MERQRWYRVARGLLVGALVAPVLAIAAPLVTGTAPLASAAAGDITTVVGSFVPGPSAATASSIGALALARFGSSLYVSDDGSCVIRRIDTGTGVQSIYAGAGGCGYSGDGGPATSAVLGLSQGLTVDAAGNLYLSENSGRVRKVNAGTGIITTVAGNGTNGSAGDNGPATSAQLNLPTGLAVDGSGNLFIADRGNGRVRRVDAATKVITTYAGGGASIAENVPATTALLGAPYDVEMTPAGNLAVAEGGGHVVRSIDSGTQLINSIAGNRVQAYGGDGGPATNASINGPVDLSYDATGDLFIADFAFPSSVIRRVDAATQFISTVAGIGPGGYSGDNGPATAAQLKDPSSVVTGPGGSFYIADSFNYRVRAVAGGTITTFGGNGYLSRSGDGGQATSAQIDSPSGVVADTSGNLYVSDPANYRVMMVDAVSGVISVFAGGGVSVPGDGGPATSAAIEPYDLAIDDQDNVYIAEKFNQRIRKVDALTHVITTFAGTGTQGFSGDGGAAFLADLDEPTGMSFDGSGNLYFADLKNSRVRRIDDGSNIIHTVAGGGVGGDGVPATSAGLSYPNGTSEDASGNLFITDWTNQDDGVVRRVDATTQVITTIAGQGTNQLGDGLPAADAKLKYPNDVLADNNGNVYVADSGHERIRRIDTNGVIDSVGGGGTGALGDGGPARWARLAGLFALNWDPSGNLLAIDGNRLVRKISAPIAPGKGGFHPVVPFRLLDSRGAVGGWGGAPLGPGESRGVQVTGTHGIPQPARAVVMNVTVTQGTAASYLTGFPTGSSPPTAANLLFAAGQTVPDHVTVAIGLNGMVSFFNQLGSVHVIADVVGWYDDGRVPGSLFNAVTPVRVLDSRTDTGGWSSTPLGPGASQDLTVIGGVVPPTATAVVMNVTATGGTAASFLRTFPAGASPPVTANLLFAAGQTVPNLVTVAVGTGGKVTFFNQLGSVHVVADLVGYYDATGDRFQAIDPTRLLDSRNPLGQWSAYVLGPAETKDLSVTGDAVPGAVLPTAATALVSTMTVTQGNQSSYLQAFPSGASQPVTANLLFAPYQTVPNAVTVGLGGGDAVSLFNQKGQVFVVVDANGYFVS